MGAYDELGGTPSEPQSPSPTDYSELGGVPSEPPPEPNMNPTKKVLTGNLQVHREEQAGKEGPKEASTFKEQWLAGWGMSDTGLMTRGKMPDYVLPEHAGMMAKIISGIPQIAGDAPEMLAGYLGGMLAGGTAGAIAGAPFGGLPTAAAGAEFGATMAANAGAFAVPAAIRQMLIDHYQKGDMKDFREFYARASSTLWQAIKGGTTGLAVGATGIASEALAPAAASPLLKLGATTAAEAGVMTATGAALEGKAPQWSDFGVAALMMGIMHGAIKPSADFVKTTAGKLGDIYAKTGLKPNEVAGMAAQDPVLHQELLSKDATIPSPLKGAVDPTAAKDNYVEVKLGHEGQVDGIGVKEEPGKLMVEKMPEEKEAPPEEPKKRSAAVNSILSRIGEQPEAPKEKLSWNKFYTSILDANDPLKQLTLALEGKEALGSKDDPWGLARSMGSVTRKADLFLETGNRDYNTLEKTGTPGLMQIWDKADDLKEYRAYRMARHAVDLENAGIKTGVDVAQAKKAVKELAPKYKDLAKEQVQFHNGNIDYLVDSGVLEKDKGAIMKDKWQNYSAMNRVMDVKDESSGGGKGLTPYNPIKAIKGSERQIIDPLQSDIVNTHKIIAMAERNRVMRAITDKIDKAIEAGDISWGEKEKTPMVATELKPEEMAKILEKQGFDPEEARNLNDVSTVFRADRIPLADDQIASYKDGKRQVYSGVPKGIVEAVRNMDAGTANLFMSLMSAPSKMLRTTMLNSPMFALRHVFRQEAMNLSMSKDLALPGQHVVMGLAGMFGEEGSPARNAFEKWIMSGGGGDSIASIDNDYIKSKIFDLNKETGFKDKAWNMVSNYGQAVKHGIELTDEARTFGRYQARMNSGETVDSFQAQLQARDTGIDVQRSGAKMQAYAALDPFQNIRIQGLDLLVRRLKEDPVGVSAKLTASITVPSLLLWYVNRDEKWYQQLTQQDKDMNWHFAVGDPDKGGHIFRVPKPFEPGVIWGALPVRLAEILRGKDPHAMEAFDKTIKDSVLPGYVPTIAQPIVEQFANKSMLTDSPLIPKHLEGVLPEYQSNPYTSDVAKIIASGLRQIPHFAKTPGSLGSPIMVDNYVKNWTGGVGNLVVSAVDKALEKSGIADKMGIDYNKTPPEGVWADNPFLRSFVVRYPSTNTRAIGQFFDRYGETETRLNTIKNREQQGDVQGMQKQMMAAEANGQLVRLSGFKQTISQQMALIQKVTVVPGMSPHEKRQAIDQMATSVNLLADEANKAMDQLEESMKKPARATTWH